jgi:hypothetical protein
MIGDTARKGVEYAIQPIKARCEQDGGTLLDTQQTSVKFLDHRVVKVPQMVQYPQYIRSVTLPARVICKIGGKVAWGADIRIANPYYLVPYMLGDSISYNGSVRTQYVSGEAIMAEITRQSVVRSEESLERFAELGAREKECSALRTTYRQRVRSNPQPGMRVFLGLIVEVRGPIALIQYDEIGRHIKAKDQEWVQVSSLDPGEECPK